MPKRAHFSPDRDKNSEIKRLKRQLREMQEQINKIQSESSSSTSEESEDSFDNESQVQESVICNQTDAPTPVVQMQTPLDPEITTVAVEGNSAQLSKDLPEQNFSALGEKPNCDNTEGKPIHEEVLVRWNAYLLKGLSKEQRKELIDNYNIPTNCRALIPPQVNNEIQACLTKSAQEHDGFIVALQQQLAHGLSAVGVVIEKMLAVKDESENLKILADACQLFANVHHAMSVHRKFKIIPHLNTDCKKVARTMELDEFLFSKKFAEAVKNEQSIKKSSSEFKRKTWQPSSSFPGPSGTQPSYHSLNYQRQPHKGRIKEKKERKPSDRYPKQQRGTRRYYNRK